MFSTVINHPAVRASTSAGVLVAVCALIGADRFPWAFAGVGAGWLAITTVSLRAAVRSAR